MPTKVYDGNQLSVVFGVTPIRGFATDTSVRIETESARYHYHTDLHGEVHRSRINNRSAKVTITLMKASPSNQVLSNYLELDNRSNAGIFPIFIKDSSSTNIFISTSASIMEEPKIEYGEEAKTVEWVIMATNNTNYIGS